MPSGGSRRGRIAGARNSAFTLIEIMAVLLVLSIAAAIVLPEFGRHDDLKVASASRELVADLLFAQSQAIATGKPVYIRFDPPGGRYEMLESIDPPIVMNHPQTRQPYEVVLGSGPLRGVTIARADFDHQPVLAFDATGSPQAYDRLAGQTLTPVISGTVVLIAGEVSQTVSIQPMSGQIKVR